MEKLNLPEKYKYKIIEIDESRAIFRISHIINKELAQEWIKEYEQRSETVWRVQRTHKSTGRLNVFKGDFRCQHNVQQVSKNMKESKNTGCRAVLKITIQRYFSLPKHKEPLPEVVEFPALCELLYSHNHLLDSAAIKRFKPLSESTRKRLIELFELGHTAASARQMLQMELVLQCNEDYEEVCMDNSKLPSLSVINHLLNNEFRKVYGSRKESDINREVEKFISCYNQQPHCKAAFSKEKDSLAIAVVTPIMKRSIDLLRNVQELIMVDASGHMDRLNHRVYFFISPGVAGGVPIGCIITNAEETNIFREGVRLLCDCFPEKCCLSQNGPLIVMTDDDLKEREVLSEIWPNSTYLLCQFHVLKAMWRWLMNSHHKILKEHRQELYFSFKALMYAETEVQLKELLQNMLENSKVRKYDKFIIYLSKLFSKKQLWCTCFRKMLLTRGNNTTNYVESLFKVLKETILGRVKAFSLVQLLDFIVTKFEKYLHCRYLDFSFGRSSKKLVKKFLPDDKGIQNIKALNDDNTYFEVDDYFVDLESSICTCFVGMNGKLCKHLSAVILNQNKQSTFIYSLESKKLMYEVATGKKLDENSTLLLPLSFNPEHNAVFPLVQSNYALHPQFPSITLPHSSNNTLSQSNNNTLSHSSNDTLSHLAIDKFSQSCDDNNMLLPTNNTTSQSTCQNSDSETDDDVYLQQFDDIINRIKSGYKNNPDVFKPAIKKMVKNVNKFGKTETGLVSALHNFGRNLNYSSRALKCNRRSGNQIPVQPTAIARRKSMYCGRKSQVGGRPVKRALPPALKEHAYGIFSELPSKHPKTKHSLTHCVEKNVSLPS